jgi:hypothetical protein
MAAAVTVMVVLATAAGRQTAAARAVGGATTGPEEAVRVVGRAVTPLDEPATSTTPSGAVAPAWHPGSRSFRSRASPRA